MSESKDQLRARLVELGERRARARAEVSQSTAELRDFVRRFVASGDFSELEVAKVTGVSRMTVRDWLHK
jgi:hypothetical protein